MHSWCLLVCVGVCWCLLVCVGVCWCLLVFVGVCWCLLVCVGVCWCLLVFVGVCWCLLVFVGVYWCLLVCVGVCWCVLVRVGVCWCVLVCVGVCWCVLVFVVLFEFSLNKIWLYFFNVYYFLRVFRLRWRTTLTSVHCEFLHYMKILKTKNNKMSPHMIYAQITNFEWVSFNVDFLSN